MPFKLPEIESCCGCVPSLRTASAIIIVLAIITNPLLSWLMIRHTYALRLSCSLSTVNRVDILDVNINNVISFGFGVNADLGASCLTNNANATGTEAREGISSQVIKGLGWVLLIVDVMHLAISVLFLVKLFGNPIRRVINAFMIVSIIAVLLSTIYGIMYVVVCGIRGKGIALCQFILTLFDLGLWIYFLMVVNAYRKKVLVSARQE